MASHMERLKKEGSSTAVNKKSKLRPVMGKKNVTEEVDKVVNAFVEGTVSAGVDGIRKDFADTKGYTPSDLACQKFKENEERNRYKDVICLDSTRCVLTLNVPPDTDYIHANWVKMENVDRVFIAAQGPLENTVSDFWRLVYQENVSTILMLCKCVEDEKLKCFGYWPAEQGSYKTYGTMFVNNKKTDKEDRFITFTLEILPDGCSNSIVTKLYQMVDWPDRGVPQSGMSLLRLLRQVPTNKNLGPCLVHCSAGVGRTGTILMIEAAVARLWKGLSVNMKEIMQQLRDRRASMVQTEGQYVFAHLVVLCYISAKLPKHREAIMNFYEQFKQAQLT